MSTKTKSPVAAIAIAALVVVGGLAVLTQRDDDDTRQVKFNANWRPTFVRATTVTFGPLSREVEVRPQIRPQFNETRWLKKGEIAYLEVLLPDREEIAELTCSIQVGGQAPKFFRRAGVHACNVQHYVS